jgi:hypothetical protein
MVVATVGAWGKGRQSLAPPQHTETVGARPALRTSIASGLAISRGESAL